MSKNIKYATSLILGCFFGSMSSVVVAVEFEDYDYSRWSQEVTQCDLLASHGRDPGHLGPSITSKTMDKPAAIAACEEAVKNDPENPRLNYQLGRAYGYSDRGEEAMPYRLKALEANYPQSTFVIGYLHLIGVTIEQDTCRAFDLWQQSAKNRRLAALVALPRHHMRGDFADCKGEISREDMAAYLAEASTLTSDFYATTLIAVLQEKLADL
jgi:TPR repeat protein